MSHSECSHGQLYAIVKVEVKVPIEHNSAQQINQAYTGVARDMDTIRKGQYVILEGISVIEEEPDETEETEETA